MGAVDGLKVMLVRWARLCVDGKARRGGEETMRHQSGAYLYVCERVGVVRSSIASGSHQASQTSGEILISAEVKDKR